MTKLTYDMIVESIQDETDLETLQRLDEILSDRMDLLNGAEDEEDDDEDEEDEDDTL